MELNFGNSINYDKYLQKLSTISDNELHKEHIDLMVRYSRNEKIISGELHVATWGIISTCFLLLSGILKNMKDYINNTSPIYSLIALRGLGSLILIVIAMLFIILLYLIHINSKVYKRLLIVEYEIKKREKRN